MDTTSHSTTTGDHLPDGQKDTLTTIASGEVDFAGTIYDKKTVQALRFHSKAYLHGHTVGGTNPSLIEAMAAGDPVIAQDNKYNRWVIGEGALYFDTIEAAYNSFSFIGSCGSRDGWGGFGGKGLNGNHC